MTTYRCYASGCHDPIDGKTFTSETAAAKHENAYHDGAQTCWSDEERDEEIARSSMGLLDQEWSRDR